MVVAKEEKRLTKGKYLGIVGGMVVLVMIVGLFRSCGEKPAISDQVVVTGIGIEQGDGGYRLTVQAIDVLKTASNLSEQSESATSVYTVEGRSVGDGLYAFLNEVGRETYIPHNQVIALQADLCKTTSVFQLADYFLRNAETNSQVPIVLCRQSPKKLLEYQSNNDVITAEYTARLLQEGYESGQCVLTRMLDLQRAYSGMCDLVVPILNVSDTVPQLDGTGVFSEGRLVGELTPIQTMGLLFADDRINHTLQTVDAVTFRIDDCSTHTTAQEWEESFIYTFAVSGKVSIGETDKLLTKRQRVEYVERLSAQLELTITDALETVTAWQSDPLYLTRLAAKQTGCTQEKAADRLSESRFEVTVDLHFVETGFLKNGE